MSWTAELLKVNKIDPTSLEIDVSFSNGTDTRVVPFRVSNPDSIKRIIKDQINQYEAIEAAVATLQLGAVDLTPPAKAPDPVPETDRQVFAEALTKYRRTKIAFDLGLVTQTALDNAATDMKTAYKPRFLGMLDGLRV